MKRKTGDEEHNKTSVKHLFYPFKLKIMEFLLCEVEASKFAFVNKPGPRPLTWIIGSLSYLQQLDSKKYFCQNVTTTVL